MSSKSRPLTAGRGSVIAGVQGALPSHRFSQDEIAEAISTSMNQRFTRSSSRSVDGEAYDLFLRASPRAFSPAELHSLVPILEKVVERAPEFAEA